MNPSRMREPAVVATPRVRKRSFTATGMPSSAPRAWPAARRASDPAAAARARSPVTVRKAPTRPSVAAIRARQASVSWREETAPAARRPLASWSDRPISSAALTR